MTNQSIQTKTLDLRSELFSLKAKECRKFASKAMLALAGVVAGIASLIFLSMPFAPYGIGLIVISAIVLYHFAQQYRVAHNVLKRSAEALTK